MRDIKFRAWDTHDHEWYRKPNPPKRMTYYANPSVDDDGYIHFESVGQTAIGDHGEDRHIIMQYTGIKDKNGVEIYEGDVVDDGKDIKFPEDWEWLDMCHEEIEVIGNIHENPELLNKL